MTRRGDLWTCPDCGEAKPPTAFHKGKAGRRDSYCAACSLARKKARYEARKSGARPLLTVVEKRCTRCGEVKAAAEFRTSYHNDTGLEPRCNDCVGHDNRMRIFGLKEAEHAALLARQRGGCAICGQSETTPANHGRGPRSLAVDHDHRTGRVRGLLCANCNKALGCMADDPDRLLAAANYLLQQVDVLGISA